MELKQKRKKTIQRPGTAEECIGGGSNGNVNNNDDTYEQEANTADFANINVFIDI